VEHLAPPRAHGHIAIALVIALAPGCSGDRSVRATQDSDAQQVFWQALESLCGRAFEGRLVEAPAGDTTFAGKTLTMHVRQCADAEIRIPFHVSEDRSRTWVVSRQPTGLRLKHDHRHADGSEDAITQYGGDTFSAGSADRQEFRADSTTAAMIPAAVSNVWILEVVPGQRFAYALRRDGTDRRFRIEFDITKSVAVPPAPWGF
jgi:hypothetical protein